MKNNIETYIPLLQQLVPSKYVCTHVNINKGRKTDCFEQDKRISPILKVKCRVTAYKETTTSIEE